MTLRRPGRRPRAAAHRGRPARAARVLGTLNNCASGITPWGTYLTCEENFIFYFKGPDAAQRARGALGPAQGRPGGLPLARVRRALRRDQAPERAQPLRLDGRDRPLQPEQRAGQAHRAGPRARTKARPWPSPATAAPWSTGRGRALRVHLQVRQPRHHQARRRARRTPTCSTTARCTWRASTPTAAAAGCALTHGQGPLTAANGFADQGEVLIKTRQASDLLGATKMDRPEWIAVDKDGWVYCTLTNNSNRGGDKQPGRRCRQPARQQHDGQHHPLEGRRRLRRHDLPLEPLRAGRRPGQRARRGPGQRQGRRLRLPRRPVGRRPRRAVDPDRHVAPRPWARATWRTWATT